MLGVVFFFIAFVSTFTINGNPLRDGNLKMILKELQSRVENDRTSDETFSTSGGDDGHSLRERGLKTMDVIDLIQRANLKKAETFNHNKRHREVSPYSANYYQNKEYDPNNNYKKNDRLMDRLFEQLTQQERKPLKKTLTPNRLLNPIKYKEDNGLEQTVGSNGYSKILLVLDPTALQNSRNSDNISSLVSRILSQSFSAIDQSRQDRNKLRNYKGFMVNKNSRRNRKESKEMYGNSGGGGDGGVVDMEDDYRPKRPRSDHGGGGARTAIPYIRHRGDIYEREN